MTQGVLVSVSVSTVVYTRILVSDRIAACPYRPFSTSNTGGHFQDRRDLQNISPPFPGKYLASKTYTTGKHFFAETVLQTKTAATDASKHATAMHYCLRIQYRARKTSKSD